jgi:heme exporter protein D
MNTISEFFHMGGYAFYVWTSYAVAALVLALNLALPLARRSRLLADLRRRARARRPA